MQYRDNTGLFLAYHSGFKAGFMVFKAHLELLYNWEHIGKLKINTNNQTKISEILKEILYSENVFWMCRYTRQ